MEELCIECFHDFLVPSWKSCISYGELFYDKIQSPTTDTLKVLLSLNANIHSFWQHFDNNNSNNNTIHKVDWEGIQEVSLILTGKAETLPVP